MASAFQNPTHITPSPDLHSSAILYLSKRSHLQAKSSPSFLGPNLPSLYARYSAEPLTQLLAAHHRNERTVQRADATPIDQPATRARLPDAAGRAARRGQLGGRLIGGRALPGRPVALGIVILAILAAEVLGLAAYGVKVTGLIPAGLPELGLPMLRAVDVEGIVPLAAGCLLLAYVEGVSAARSFAEKHGYALDPRQEFLGIGASNLLAGLGHGYPVAGGLSQSAVSEKAGARTPLALVFASVTLAFCLLFLTSLLVSLPKAVLAAVVLTAVAGLIDVKEMVRLWRVSRIDFAVAAVALTGVLLLGILQGILLAALASILMLLARASRLQVAFLGRMPGTGIFGDMDRHPENTAVPGILAFRPEGSLLYINAESVQEVVLARVASQASGTIRTVVCDLSTSPVMDLAGVRMLRKLQSVLTTQGIHFAIAGPHGRVRDLLRRDGFAEIVGDIARDATLEAVLQKATATSG